MPFYFPFKRIQDYLTLCKPKVVFLMLITTWVGMYLATNKNIPWSLFIFGSMGIILTSSSAAVINHILDQNIDTQMSRTQTRPIASKRISVREAGFFSFLLMLLGLSILFFYVNYLTAILTFLALLGYAVFYTLFLKTKTPQNIVIGGVFGAMPPLLGWTSVRGVIDPEAWVLVLIIFAWTPPHFWALAIYRLEDYVSAKIPMLPVTHGIKFTKICIVLYTLLLFAISLLPFAIGMCDFLYLIAASLLGGAFLTHTIILYYSKQNKSALKTFSFSILYLLLLFVALLADHGLKSVTVPIGG